MCGIAGVFGTNDSETVREMLKTLLHRGPDDEHLVSGHEFTLGARRLSIVDLADGRQPLCDESGTIFAAQNGELYNFEDVKNKLSAKGHKFATRCDTEIIPHLYEEYGSRLVEHLDGMFAICVWDSQKSVGLLARDRLGKKPLYYTQIDDSLYFASEIKALLAVRGVSRRINFESVTHFLSLKHIPAPMTIFEGIWALPPAHTIVFRPGEEIKVERYWDLDFTPNKEVARLSEAELRGHLLNLLRKAVKKRLMADVPIGFFLSGGIDSSLATAIAAEINSDPIKTFTLVYSKDSTTSGKDEDRRWARWAANKFRTEHHEHVVEFSQFPMQLKRIISCFDQPFAGTVSTFFLASLIAQHVKVALSGDGADELFGSYFSHRLAFPLSNYSKFRQLGNVDLIRPFEDQIALLEKLHDKPDWQWRSDLLVFDQNEKSKLLSSEIQSSICGLSTEETFQRDFSLLTAKDPLNRILEFEYKGIFSDQVLTYVDRLSMAHSLEIRSAFHDTELVEFVASLPGHFKIRNGETKHLLKQAALEYFPEEMVFRKKEGFLMPITEWFIRDLEPYVRETLSHNNLSSHGIFNHESVDELVNSIYRGTNDYRQVNKVFALVVFQEWYQLYMSDQQQNHCGKDVSDNLHYRV